MNPVGVFIAGAVIDDWGTRMRSAAIKACKWLIAFTAVLVVPVAFSQCVEDSVRSVTSDGDVLITLTGKAFEIIGGGQIDVALWLPTDDLLICGPKTVTVRSKKYTFYTIINTDDKEKVDAIRLK